MLRSAAAAVSELLDVQPPEISEEENRLQKAVMDEMEQLNQKLQKQELEFQKEYSKIEENKDADKKPVPPPKDVLSSNIHKGKPLSLVKFDSPTQSGLDDPQQKKGIKNSARSSTEFIQEEVGQSKYVEKEREHFSHHEEQRKRVEFPDGTETSTSVTYPQDPEASKDSTQETEVSTKVTLEEKLFGGITKGNQQLESVLALTNQTNQQDDEADHTKSTTNKMT
uniref:Uncharacterized protein n=1 Tax=Ditylenchus dipsaci TaxID=166011 RepID=A0A915EN01_9BILA